jgi:putative ATP-dependent endonuclease of OLD family
MGWANSLSQHAVFFSAPLDLDMMMLEAFPDAYAAIIPKGGGPDLTVDEAAVPVLKGKGAGLARYTGAIENIRELFPAYRYHFLTHSKPATHLQAMVSLKSKDLREGAPEILREVLAQIQTNLRRD